MKKTLIPMVLIAATLLTGCKANDIIDNSNKTSNESAAESLINEDNNIEQVAESSIAPVVAPVTTDSTTPDESDNSTNSDETPLEAETTPTVDTANAGSSNASELNNYPAYKNLVAEIKNTVLFHPGLLSDYSPALAHYYEICQDSHMEDVVQVSLYDINNDGTPELFFCRYTPDWSGILILDMYTLNNGSIVKVFSCEEYESYAYCNGIGIVHSDDTQIIDVLTLNGTSLQIAASYAPEDNFSYTKDDIPGPTYWLASC